MYISAYSANLAPISKTRKNFLIFYGANSGFSIAANFLINDTTEMPINSALREIMRRAIWNCCK